MTYQKYGRKDSNFQVTIQILNTNFKEKHLIHLWIVGFVVNGRFLKTQLVIHEICRNNTDYWYSLACIIACNSLKNTPFKLVFYTKIWIIREK